MKAEEVTRIRLVHLIEEAQKHPGSAELVADVLYFGPDCGAPSALVSRGRLEGWLMRHLAEPEKGEADRLLEALREADADLSAVYGDPGGYAVFDVFSREIGDSPRGASPLEALRAAFPEVKP